ncbi:MAG: recombination protein O N-terminal domain-containing protein, partial [Halomonas sp.]
MTPEPAFLLHRRPYRETSALVELLTLHHGRVRA